MACEEKELLQGKVPQDKITSPRYIDALRNTKDIIPLQDSFFL